MNPLLLLALPEVLKALAPLLTVAAQHGGGQPSEPASNTASKLDPAVLSALVTAAQRPPEPLPEIKLPRSASVVATIVIIGFFALLSAIAGLLVLGHGEFGAALAVLCVGFGVCASKFGTVVDFMFGSSWGSRQKDARPPAEPASPSIFLPPPVAPSEPEPQPAPPVEPGTWTSTTTTETPVAVDGIGRSTDPSAVKNRSDVPYDGKTPAAIRYNNPGASWESPTDYKFGLLGYGLLKDGNHIGRFPHGVNGAASNFALLDRKYVGMDIKKARETWTDDVNFLGGYDPNMVITHEFVRDRATAIPLLKAIANWEAGNAYPLSDADWQNAHAMFLAGSADAWLDRQSTKVVKPTDLAAAIVAAMRRKGYVLDMKPGEINIVYVEGLNEDGTINDDAPDKWNDLRACIGFDGDKPVVLGRWEGTTEPGRYYTDAPVNPAGAARIEFGQFSSWKVGMHRGHHEALIQHAPVTVCRDLNRDMVRTGDARETGLYGINQHGGYDQSEASVGKASAGCLVGRTMSGHRAFMSIVKSDPRFVEDPEFIFTTTILAERCRRMITVERLREILNYDPSIGVFRWRRRVETTKSEKTWNTRFSGNVAGSLYGSGCVSLSINNKTYKAHRLAWLYSYGIWPSSDIDHVNGDYKDNRLSNLRMATPRQNQANGRKPRNNTSGYKGVSWDIYNKQWRAYIHFDRRSQYLGLFPTPEAAHAAYCDAAKEHFGEFARLS